MTKVYVEQNTNTAQHLNVKDASIVGKTSLATEKDLLNAQDENGWTPLHHAVHSGDIDLVKSLISRGADLSITNYCAKDTPVSHTFKRGPVKLVRYFVEVLGIDPMTADERGLTLFGQAVVGGNLDIIKYLMNRKGSTYDGNNLLEIAILCGHLGVVGYLVWEKEVNVNFAGENGWTPLLYAVERDELDMAWYLIEMGADVNATTEDGTTALHIAAEGCNLEMVECLVENGANINAKDKEGKTPLSLVTPGEDVAEYLISFGARI
ncbi:MAG: ankyrin repeat domain-containing protein [Rickettsiales bacterium]|jgi:ankyrin repeat protein|nr:ankyrin repeat domain-containing protein [Rickettsiales bacterium]MDR1260904.1 ankyrin repeat domain-containing protein [Rickettsiales bacterium]